MSSEREKELLNLAQSNETDVKNLLKAFYAEGSNELLDDFIKFVWSLDVARKAMKDMQLDVAKLPLGCLKIERVKKSLIILQKI